MTEWTPDAQERFCSKRYEEVADPDDQPEDGAQKVASAVGGISRREMLAGAGILGGGALLGGGGTAALTGDAQAAASTVDGDGDIGTPSNPEDVFADAVAVFDGANNQIGSFDETGIETPSVDTADTSSDPANNGEIQRNGTDIKAYSGGAVRNLSDIGGGNRLTADSNSPWTGSSTTSLTATLGDTYDIWKVNVELSDQSNSSSFIGVRFNGDSTSNYTYYDVTGSESTLDRWQAGQVESGGAIKGTFWTPGRWTGSYGTGQAPSIATQASNSSLVDGQGHHSGLSSPLNKITVVRLDGNNMDVSIEAEGRDIA